MAANKKRPDRSICYVSLDTQHRWAPMTGQHPADQLTFLVDVCAACGAVRYSNTGQIDPGQGSPEGARP